MALYDFRCLVCKNAFEARVKVDDRNVQKVCPECGGVSERQKLYPTPFRMKPDVLKGIFH